MPKFRGNILRWKHLGQSWLGSLFDSISTLFYESSDWREISGASYDQSTILDDIYIVYESEIHYIIFLSWLEHNLFHELVDLTGIPPMLSGTGSFLRAWYS